jgi:hypothetical protein
MAFKLLRQVERLLMILIPAVHQRNHEECINEDPVRHASLRSHRADIEQP